MKTLAQRVDTVLGDAGFACLSTARPTPTPGAMIYETDTNRIMVGIAVASVNHWVPLPGTKVCFLYATSTQSIPDGAGTPIQLHSNVNGDPFGVWNAGTPTRIKPTFPGHYSFSGAVSYASNATGYRAAYWYAGGALIAASAANISAVSGSGLAVVTRTITRWMNGTTDYVELVGYQTSNAALSTSVSAGYQSGAVVTYLGAGKDASTP